MAGRNTAPGLTRTEAAAFPGVSAGGPAAPGVPRGQSWFAGGARHPASIRPHLAEEYAINLPLHPNRHDVFIKNVTEPIICVYVTAVHVVSLGTNNTPLHSGEGGRWFGRGAFLRGFEGGVTPDGAERRNSGTEEQRVLTGRENRTCWRPSEAEAGVRTREFPGPSRVRRLLAPSGEAQASAVHQPQDSVSVQRAASPGMRLTRFSHPFAPSFAAGLEGTVERF